MVKRLVKHGNALALVIDRPILDLLKIAEDTALDISTEDGKTLRIIPLDPATRSRKIEEALKKTNAKFGKTLKNLAK